jgi:hypothetical protein
VFWYWEGALTPSSDPHPVLPDKMVTAERTGKDGFKRELLYCGVSQNTQSIVYREFRDDTGRPAYFQNLKYDLSQGNVIAYQGARFQVIKADNTKVRYKVLNTLD